jgi:hypothetical protein
LAVVHPATDFHIPCAREFDFDLSAQCGKPPYNWSLVDAGFPPGVTYLETPSEGFSFYGTTFTCDATTAEVEVTDGVGDHAIVSVVFQ